MKMIIVVLAMLLGGCRISAIVYADAPCEPAREFDYKPQHICLCATSSLPNGQATTCKWVNLPQAFEAQK